MNSHLWRRLVAAQGWKIAWLGCGLSMIGVDAQEVERNSLAGPAGARLRVPDNYNVRWRDAAFLLEPSFSVEFNDNIAWHPDRRQDDVILRPNVRLGAFWPITPYNALQGTLGIGYEIYTRHTSVNSGWPLISPESALAWNFYTGDFRIQVHDRFSYQEDLYLRGLEPVTAGGAFYNVSGTPRLARLDNFAGTRIDWDLHQLILSLNYDHESFAVSGADFNYLDRETDLPGFTATFIPSDAWRVGMEIQGLVTTHSHRQELLSDRWSLTTGPYAQWRISENLTVRGGAGYAGTRLTRAVPATSAEDTWYAYGRVDHRVNWFLSQSLAIGKETQEGVNADYLDDTYVRHRTTWQVWRAAELSTRLAYLSATEHGGVFRDRFDFYNVGVDVTWHWAKHSRLTAGYVFAAKVDGNPLPGYHQNRASVGITYEF